MQNNRFLICKIIVVRDDGSGHSILVRRPEADGGLCSFISRLLDKGAAIRFRLGGIRPGGTACS
jgi:hypothetical protein